MDILQQQIDGALLLQKSEAVIISVIKLIRKKYANSPEQDLELYDDLLALLDTAVEFGKLKYLHESTLKDDRNTGENPQKEG